MIADIVPPTDREISSLIHDNLRLGPIVYRPEGELLSFEHKLKTHKEEMVQAIMASMRVFGLVVPLPIDRKNRVIDGEAVLEAARRLGLQKIPTVKIDHLTDHHVRLLRLTLKTLAKRSDWDREALRMELKELVVVDDEITIDITGFSMTEVDNILAVETSPEVPEELPEPIQPDAAVAALGDLWHLGRHKVLCGSSLDVISFQLLMGDERARMSATDAPYNVKIDRNVSGRGKHKHREFVQGSSELSKKDFQEFLKKSMGLHGQFCVNGGMLYMFMDYKHGGEMYWAIEENELSLIGVITWAKTNAANGALYRSQTEFCFIAKVGSAPYLNCVQMGKYGRHRSTLWTYPGMNSFGKDRDELLAMHPTVKNLDMICDAIRDVTHRGDIVLDGFLGSGTTLIACERTDRICRGIELDPLYVDCIIRRWEKMTGEQARLGPGGPTFAEVSAQRSLSVEPVPVDTAEPTPAVRIRIRPVATQI